MRKVEKAPVSLYAVHDSVDGDYTFVTHTELIRMHRKFTLIPERPQTDNKVYLHRYLRVAK